MNKENFMKRCESYRDSQDDMKPINEDTFVVMREALNYTMSMHSWRVGRANEEMEKIRTYDKWRTQASFRELYSALAFSYRLSHPCKSCAEDPKSWETRYAFCDHAKQKLSDNDNISF